MARCIRARASALRGTAIWPPLTLSGRKPARFLLLLAFLSTSAVLALAGFEIVGLIRLAQVELSRSGT